MKQEKNLIVMDISSHFHRSFEMVVARGEKEKPQSYFNGKPNYMIKATLNLINNEIKKLNVNPDYIVCVLDADGDNFRHRLYPDYKGTRPPSDKEYNFMKKCCEKLLQLKGYYVIKQPDVEADDVIATIVTKTKAVKNLNVYICTGDKDMFYLIDEKTKVFAGSENKGLGVLYDIQGCINKKGVEPKKINDFLTMDGDKVDNIMGIPNLGKKTIPIILEHFTLNEIIENPELLYKEGLKVRGRDNIVTYIKENKDFIKLMQKLVIMRDDIPLGVNLRDFIKGKEDSEALKSAFKSLGLKH